MSWYIISWEKNSIVKCTGCKKDENENITEIYCEYDPETKSGMPGSMRKVKGTLHWVSAKYCKTAEVRLYDRLFNVENPSEEKDKDFRELLNTDSLKVIDNVKIEPYLAEIAKSGELALGQPESSYLQNCLEWFMLGPALMLPFSGS